MGGYAAVLQSLSEQIGNLRNEVSEARKPQQTEEQTRNELARKFVVGYFRLIGGGFLLAIAYNIILAYCPPANGNVEYLSIKDTILVITSAVGTPLGFVVGYYFKTNGS